MRLEGFPLAHEIADLPHEGLMAIARLLRGDVIVVEALPRHRRFELLDLRFALRDARFEFGDARFQRADFLVLAAAFGVGRLSRVAIDWGGWGRSARCGGGCVGLGLW